MEPYKNRKVIFHKQLSKSLKNRRATFPKSAQPTGTGNFFLKKSKKAGQTGSRQKNWGFSSTLMRE